LEEPKLLCCCWGELSKGEKLNRFSLREADVVWFGGVFWFHSEHSPVPTIIFISKMKERKIGNYGS